MESYEIREGMVVYSADGYNVGKVVSRGSGYFIIEKGLIFKTDHRVLDQDIARRDGDEIWLSVRRDDLAQREDLAAGAESPASAVPYQQSMGTPRIESDAPVLGTEERAARMPGAEERFPAAEERIPRADEQARVQLSEEELEVSKRARKAGEVRVRKEVITEQKQVNVPVTREEVRVERVPASGEPSEASFTEDEVTIPVTEEEVEVRKRPVVREEVRVSKTPVQEQRVASAEVRREEVDIETEGDVERRDAAGRRDYEDPFTKK